MNTITYDPSTWPSGDLVWTVCQAIALAEGANVEGSVPDRYCNPGDLSRGDEHGQSVQGYTTLPDGEDLIIFADKTGGWKALYKKIDNARKGLSSVYKPTMTWIQFSKQYAGDSADWVRNVTDKLGVDLTSRFGDFFVDNSEAVQDAASGEN